MRSFLLWGRKTTTPKNGDKFSTAHPKSLQGFASLGSGRMCFRAPPFTARSSLRPFSGDSLARALTSFGLVAAHAQRMPRAGSGRPVQHILPSPAPHILKCASALEDRMPRLIRRHVLEYYGKNPDRKNRSLKSLYKKETDSPSTISKLEKLKPPDFISKGFELLLADRLHKRNDIRQYFRRYCFLDCGILGKLTGFAMLKQMIKPRI